MTEWRTFEKFPEESKCPICGTNEDKPCVLIVKAGTQDGWLAEAVPVHADCIDPQRMIYDENVGVVYILGVERS